MDLQEAICPKCGSPSRSGELCGKCKAEGISWFRCEPRVFVTRCPICGSLRQNSMWSDCDASREDLEYEAVSTAISFYQDVRRPEIGISLEHNSQNRTVARATLSGTLYDQNMEDTCTIEVIWQNDACDRCNRLHGNYWEGIVQIRAENRKATIQENDEAKRIAGLVEASMQEQGDRLSFLSKIEETREGLDIIVSSQSIGETVAREITRRMGGKFSLHPTLAGEKDGKKLYRITYAVRLPKYQKGDIIQIRGTYGTILGAESKTFTYLDLMTGLPKTVPESTQARLAGHVRDAVPMMIVYQDNEIVGVMDTETGKTEEISSLSWKNLIPGETVRVFRDGDRLIVV